MAVEEQGCKTLHAHFLLWIDGWKDLLQCLYSQETSRGETRDVAASELVDYVDHIVSTKLHDEEFARVLHLHDCKDGSTSSVKPVPVSPQELRNLRHKTFSANAEKRTVMRCPECNHKFSSEEFVENVLKSTEMNLGNIESFPNGKGCEAIDVTISQCQSGLRNVDTVYDQKCMIFWSIPSTTCTFWAMQNILFQERHGMQVSQA